MDMYNYYIAEMKMDGLSLGLYSLSITTCQLKIYQITALAIQTAVLLAYRNLHSLNGMVAKILLSD